MAVRKLPSPNLESVRRQFSYDPKSGILIRTRLNRTVTCRTVLVNGIEYRKSRICWLIETGEWPDEVDHEDTDELNDKWSNLRKCTHQQNLCNRKVAKHNKLGIKGVSAHQNGFTTRARFGGKIKRQQFRTLDAAIDAYAKWSLELQGEFRRI